MEEINTQEDLITLFKKYKDLLYRYTFIRTGYSKEIAEDLTQDIFVKVWERREQYNSYKSSVKTWIFRIARNHIIDFYRKKKEVILDENIENTLSEQESIEKQVLMVSLLKSLKSLQSLEQDIILYKYLYGIDDKEIAVIINKSYEATRVLLHRTIIKLKKITNEKSK